MTRQALQIEPDGLFDIEFGLSQGLALRVATGQGGDERYLAAVHRLFVIDRI